MENVDLLRLVVSFVGPKHYRFIAMISQKFHAAYTQEFPDDTETELNASTKEYAKICWEDLEYPSVYQQYKLSLSAACFGSLSAMQYLHSVDCDWDENICAFAALIGHLHILQYARKNGCPWDEKICAVAAKYGRLDILRYAHKNGCPWDERTCARAALNGHLNVLQYAHVNGCPWNKETCTNAAENDHLHILQYARDNGCPES